MAYKVRILPRWLVFLLDLFLVCFCLLLSRMLKLNFNWAHVDSGYRFMMGVVLVINAVFCSTFSKAMPELYATLILKTHSDW